MRRRTWLAGFVTVMLLAVSAPAAQASFGVANDCPNPINTQCWVAGIYNGDYTGMNDRDYLGPPTQDAGGHPFVGVTDFQVNQTSSNGPPDGIIKTIRVDLPQGLISNPQAVPKCTDSQFPSCPTNTQLGIVELEAWESPLPVPIYVGTAVYNTPVEAAHCAGYLADYAFNTPSGRVDICGGVRSTTDDGLYFNIAAPSGPELIRSTLIFWGVPGDTGHDPQRGWSCGILSVSLVPCTPPTTSPGTPEGTPFLSNPSGCVPAGQDTTLTLDSTTGDQATSTSTTPVPAINCSTVPFNPSLTLTPQTTASDSPTGAAVDLHVPQNEDPAGQASATLQNASVTLPPGMTLDPSAANGLAACSPAQFGRGSDAPPTCPASSEGGTVEIDTPLLATPLTGTAYLGCDGASAATPCPAANGLAYLYLYATAPGVTQKLLGTVTANPQTGQLTTTFLNQPQIPFTDLKLNFKSGPTAPLANPLTCGQATTTSALTPYSGNPSATPSTSFMVDSNGAGGGCPQPLAFAPGLTVNPATSQAAAFDSPLTVLLTRAQQQQYLGRMSVTLPPGLIGLIASVPLCPAGQAATGTCPAASRIGSTSVVAGSGADPITQAGNVYLTGPYNGAPYGLSIVVPAIAGPFNLGTVVVRAAIEVDKTSARITIASDPLPQVVGGIPLRIRSVAVTIDRTAFMFNPTSCAASATDATLTSTEGALDTVASPFQAAGCAALRFAPSLHIALSGKGQTTSGKHPSLSATVGSKFGQANIRATTVTLPLSLALDPNNSTHVCSVTAAQSDSCPANTKVGSATVQTPVLPTALAGPAYLVQGIRTGPQGQTIRTLPALLITLRGAVAIDLRAQTSVDSAGRLVTTFPTVPDVPISRFTLQIAGGRRGLLVVTGRSNLCRRSQLARATLSAQNGASDHVKLAMGTPCPNHARVTGLKVAGHTIRLSVTTPAGGKVLAGGAGLRGSSRRLTYGNTVSFVLRPTPTAAAQLRRQGRLTLKVTIRYVRPGHRTKTIHTRSVTLRR